MAHYAFLDENNIVTEVIVGRNEQKKTDWEKHYGAIRNQVCKRTSYNTFGNEHMLGGTPFRGNFAGVGMYYDEENDVFYSQDPPEETGWTFNESKWVWEKNN